MLHLGHQGLRAKVDVTVVGRNNEVVNVSMWDMVITI